MTSIHRTAAEEEEDRNQALKNLVNAAYLDWPNEAGVGPVTAKKYHTNRTN